jgi:ketosteroid isomerase-like protein
MARSMTPLSSLQLEPLRTEGNAALATVWFKGSWVSGGSQEGTTVHVRGVLVWRKERDGRWRVALEHLG